MEGLVISRINAQALVQQASTYEDPKQCQYNHTTHFGLVGTQIRLVMAN